MKHSLKELKRQMDDASSKVVSAKIKFTDAKSAYIEAAIALAEKDAQDQGFFAGDKISHKNGTFFYDGFKSASFFDIEPRLFKVKNDGSMSKQKIHTPYNFRLSDCEKVE